MRWGRARQTRRRESDVEVEAAYLASCATHITWLIDHVRRENDRLAVSGWALSSAGGDGSFLLNGEQLGQPELKYPLPSPQLGKAFWNIPGSANARFQISVRRPEGELYPDGYARLDFVPHARHPWYVPDPRCEAALPEPHRIRRVIGVESATSYVIGGASTYRRLDRWLVENMHRSLDDHHHILDWGCGCGRFARHVLRPGSTARYWGVDIDADNVDWCRRHLPGGNFSVVDGEPPTELPEAAFDLIVAIAILDQLPLALQRRWLTELRRVASPGATIVVAVAGPAHVGLARPGAGFARRIETEGWVVAGRNEDIADSLPDHEDYVSGVHSRRHVLDLLDDYFSVIDVIDALATHLDVIVLQNRP